MKSTDEYTQMLDQYIARSAKIDNLVTKSPHTVDDDYELEQLRALQHEAADRLVQLEVSNHHIWDNIGNGG